MTTQSHFELSQDFFSKRVCTPPGFLGSHPRQGRKPRMTMACFLSSQHLNTVFSRLTFANRRNHAALSRFPTKMGHQLKCHCIRH